MVGSRPLVAMPLENAMKYLNEGGQDLDEATRLALEELKLGDSMAT